MEFLAQGSVESESSPPKTSDVKWSVVDMPKKGGHGVVALSNISVGECISAESEMRPEEYKTRFKFNHSCLPNAHSSADVKGKSTRYVHSLSPIEKGEEILISYCPTPVAV